MKYAGNSWTNVTSASGTGGSFCDKRIVAAWLNCWSDTSATSTGGFLVHTGTTSVTAPANIVGPVVVSGSQPAPARGKAPLDFSPTINATELVMEFLAEARTRVPGLTREQFLRFTIGDFFAFLIRRAAEADGVAPPEVPEHALLPARSPHRCGACGRFLAARLASLRVSHCNAGCLERALAR